MKMFMVPTSVICKIKNMKLENEYFAVQLYWLNRIIEFHYNYKAPGSSLILKKNTVTQVMYLNKKHIHKPRHIQVN